MSRPTKRNLLLIGCWILLMPDRPAHALDELRPFMEKKVGQIQQALAERQVREVAVGAFTSDPEYGSEKGVGIAALLMQALTRGEVGVNADSPIEVHGKYFPQLDEMRKLMIGVRIEIELSIKQPQKTLRRFNVILDENDKSIHPEKLRKVIDELFPHERKPKLGVAVGRPQLNTPIIRDGACFLTDEQGTALYGFQVFAGCKDALRPLPLTRDNPAMVFVNVQGADSITVRLINETASEFAVELTLDGLSAFLFNEEEPYLYYTVAPNSTLDVNGWYVNRNASYCFELVNYSQSVVARSLSRGNASEVGVISAYFSECSVEKPKGEAVPEDRAIGRGPRVNANFDIVRRFVSPTGRLLRPAITRKTPSAWSRRRPIQASFPSPSSNVRDVNRSLASSAEMPPPRPATRDQHPLRGPEPICGRQGDILVTPIRTANAAERERILRDPACETGFFRNPPVRDRAHARPPSPPEAVEREA